MASKQRSNEGANNPAPGLSARGSDIKTAGKRKAKPAPLKAWENAYPPYPNLFNDPCLDDCEAIFEAVGNDETDKRAVELFHAAMLKRFVERMHAAEDIEPFIARWLVSVFTKALMGAAWDEVIQLPGRKMPADWSAIHPTEARDLQLFCDVANQVNASSKITVAMRTTANSFATSYETVRSAYYKWRSRLPDLVSKSEEEK